MTSVQLRYSGPAAGFSWLVEDLRNAGLDPAFPPPDHLLTDTDIILDLRQTGDEGGRPTFSDPGGLELVNHALSQFRHRFAYVEEDIPAVKIVGVQSSRATANAVVLKNPELAFYTAVDEGPYDDLLCGDRADRETGPVEVPAFRHQPAAQEEMRRWNPWPKRLQETRRRVNRFWGRSNGA